MTMDVHLGKNSTEEQQSFIMKSLQLFHPKMKTYSNVFRPIKCIFLKSTGVTVFRYFHTFLCMYHSVYA